MFSASISVLMLVVFISQGETTTTLAPSPTVSGISNRTVNGSSNRTVNGSSTASATTVEVTPTVGGAVSTAMGGGTKTTAASGGTNTSAVGGGTATTASGSGISPTTTKMTPPPSVCVETKESGSTVSLNLIVDIDCSGDKLEALEGSLHTDIKALYRNRRFCIKAVITLNITCDSTLNITLDLSFYRGLPKEKSIKQVFQDALENGDIRNLTDSNTNYTVIFVGVTLKYSPKDGECKNVCCDGGGGELTVEQVCTPEKKCEGIEKDEKKEDGHCPGDSKNTCPDTCDKDSGGHHNSPSFAAIILLVLTKTIFC